MLKIGNAQAFWGDSPLAPQQLISQQPDLDFLTLDYLAEVSMSIMAIQQEKDPSAGYAKDFVDVVHSLIPYWKEKSAVKIVTNAGGLNPLACAKACRKILQENNAQHKKIGVVLGDDVLSHINDDIPLTTANAYLGARQIASLIRDGADIIITGRVADPSLTVAPCIAYYNWEWDDYDRLAAATIAGHLLECGTQVTGGCSTNWLDLQNKSIGYPYVIMEESGEFTITKPQNTGGIVSEETVKEQLLYEIGDPDNYLSPDVTVSFLNLQLQETAPHTIRVTGAQGRSPPSTYKVSCTYRAGFRTEGMLTIFGENAREKALACGEVIKQRLLSLGYNPSYHIECLGTGDAVPGCISQTASYECVLRIALSDTSKDSLQAFTKELASLVTCGPQGVTGYTSGRPKIRPIFGFKPHFIDKNQLTITTEVL